MVYVFYKNHVCVFLSVLKKNTLHLFGMSGGIKTLKHNVRAMLQLACHGCKNLTHTSKRAHVQRIQMVVTVRFTICVTSLHRWNKQEIKICDWFLAYYTCGVKLLEYSYAQVWNIAKRSRAQSADSSKKAYRKPSRAFNCSLFACFLCFQSGKNRMQLNCRVKRCGVKNQNRRHEVLNRGFKFS